MQIRMSRMDEWWFEVKRDRNGSKFSNSQKISLAAFQIFSLTIFSHSYVSLLIASISIHSQRFRTAISISTSIAFGANYKQSCLSFPNLPSSLSFPLPFSHRALIFIHPTEVHFNRLSKLSFLLSHEYWAANRLANSTKALVGLPVKALNW